MASSNSNHGAPLRVMLWSNPRTLSTVFLKCMSFIDGSQAINEPYACARVAGPDRPKSDDQAAAAAMEEFVESFKAQLATVKLDLPKAFDEANCTYQFVKDTLEAEYPGRSLVFCKDQAFGIHERFNMLPKGYRHTFLIRNPYKIYSSWGKVILNMMPQEVRSFVKINELPEVMMPSKFGLGELYDLLEYVKENIDPNPVIIDADDLQNNPESILRQYCEAVGIPYKESMLRWEAGDRITSDWIAADSFLRGNKLDTGGYYDKALDSTCFTGSGSPPARKDLTEDVLHCIDTVMPAYEKMYEMRLRP